MTFKDTSFYHDMVWQWKQKLLKALHFIMTWSDSEKLKLLKTLHFIMTWFDSEKQKLLKTLHFIMT
jgi:hypothetical protein